MADIQPRQLSLIDYAEAINREHNLVRDSYQAGLYAAIECGRLLTEAKEMVPHGEWYPWLEANCPELPSRTAQLYMRLHDKRDELEANPQPVADLGVKAADKLLRKSESHEAAEPGPLPSGKYEVIYADPPWSYSNSGFDQSAESHYQTMELGEIKALPVGQLVQPGRSVLALWATAPLLPDAFEVMAAWGATYKTNLIWNKGRAPGLGWFSQTVHEHLLIGVWGNGGHPDCKPVSVVEAPPGRHSAKPAQFYDLIEEMWRGPYIELFARNKREGWSTWGNQAGLKG